MIEIEMDIYSCCKFVKDYKSKLGTILQRGDLMPTAKEHERLIKAWYNYEADVLPNRTSFTLRLTDEQYTFFVLKWL
jgi:hypothetical protein